MTELALQIFEHAQIVERVDVAGDRHRHCNDMRALRRGRAGMQRLGRVAQVEIVDDREALGQPMAVDLEHRHQTLRIERAILVETSASPSSRFTWRLS